MAVIKVQGFPSPSGPLDVAIGSGERVRIIGPNGAGKTSLLRAMAGLPTALGPETATLAGESVQEMPAASLAKQLAFAHQDPRDGLIGLTVASEHRFRGLPAPDDHRDVATLSSGEARRVALAVAQAPLLLLDEPVEGLDAEGLALLRQRIADHDGTVVFVDHDGRLEDLATRTLMLAGPVHEAMPEIPAGTGPTWRRPAATTLQPSIQVPAIDVPPGFHVLVGPNGCGKSTALRHWAGLGLEPDPQVSWMGPRARDLLLGERVGDAFPALAHRHPLTLSGGEAQRVALAQTFACPRRIVLLDEPEAHLDSAGRSWLAGLIAQAVAAGRIVLAATHDPELIERAHTTIHMEAP